MKENIRQILEQKPQYRNAIFRRGYLIVDDEIDTINEYPFYGKWNKSVCGKTQNGNNLNIFTHKDQNCYKLDVNGINMAIVGHAYNPFSLLRNEEDIIIECINAYHKSLDAFFDKVSELTGIHLIIINDNGKIIFVQDCCGIMPVFYGKIHEITYFTSHAQLVADITGLEMSDFIRQYISAPFYKIGISQLCGIDSPFEQLTMLSPNTFLSFDDLSVKRFFPYNNLHDSDDTTLIMIEKTLKNSLKICADKWSCSISLTGGTDSKMTLAAANGLYDKFHYFSFISSEAEQKDAEAAHEICTRLGLEHNIFKIPDAEDEIVDYDILATLMQHNQGYIRSKTGNDVRKRIWLAQNTNIEMEIKSHVSEVGRAFYYKKLGKKRFKFPLTPRNMCNLAKRNFFDRKILVRMDQSFKRFIEISDFGNFPLSYDETDMFYWENRLPAWGALVKQSFDISHDTNILYNNRKLLTYYLAFPLENRINDYVQKYLIKKMNLNVANMNIIVNNQMKNSKRIFLEKLFFIINNF